MVNIARSATRAPAVAGLFYPADAQQLAHNIKHLLMHARRHELTPKAIIVPHAGYQYSGETAATAYATLFSLKAVIKRVILLGPAHRMAVRGLALPDTASFTTPLGSTQVDAEATQAIIGLPQVTLSYEAHALEHSLEVQLPFLQRVLSDFSVLPLAIGQASAEEVAEVLDLLWGGEETLFVISSDLSHYLPYAMAQEVDNATVQSILQLKYPVEPDHACGATPIDGLIVASRKYSLTPHLLDLRNSGDTAGSRDQVVGYAAMAFCEG